MKNKVTISDVSRHCGVSKSTVSHAFSGKRVISEAVRQRVFKAAERLDYKPSAIAKMMNARQTMLVGVVVDQCTNPFTSLLFEALSRALERHAYGMLLSVSGPDLEKGRSLLGKFSNGIVDGVVNMHPLIEATEAKKLCRPVPSITYLRQEFSPIRIDYRGGTLQALAHLWSLGHRDIGIIYSTTRDVNGEDPCLTAYRQFMTERNAWRPELARESLALRDGIGMDSGELLAPILWKQGVTAIFAGADITAFGIYYWAHENKIRIPEDLSVVGCDGSPICTIVNPQLTTLQFDADELAEHTIASLFRLIHGSSALGHQTTLIEPKLIVRASCAPPRQAFPLSPCQSPKKVITEKPR